MEAVFFQGFGASTGGRFLIDLGILEPGPGFPADSGGPSCFVGGESAGAEDVESQPAAPMMRVAMASNPTLATLL
jgi:hypothetical protein